MPERKQPIFSGKKNEQGIRGSHSTKTKKQNKKGHTF